MRDGITIYFIRHGETDWNAERRYQGQRDIPLNERGRAQARRNGEVLKALMPALASFEFVSSPLGRAIETMHIIRATLGLPLGAYRVDPRVMEVNYGAWEGQLAADLPVTDPDGIKTRLTDPFGFRPRDGESYAELMQRTNAWIDSVDRDTVVVSHGGVSRTVRGAVLALPPAQIMTLDVPQDRVLVLTRGAARWI